MTRSIEERTLGVRALVEAARRVALDPAILPDVARGAGLSSEGVRLAIAHHLELTPSYRDLAALVAATMATSRVHVILSATVFVAALRAIAVARATAPLVTVRPSTREPVFPRALVRELGDPRVTIDEALEIGAIDAGEIHVYGRDETIASVRARARPGVVVRGHGAGMGVAFVTRSADLARAGRDLTSDVIPFDQRGCLSPRIALVEGDDSRAEAFAAALHDALSEAGRGVPRGVVSAEESAEAARYLQTVAFLGRSFRGEDHAVGFAAASALLIPPPGRHVHVLAVRDGVDMRRCLTPIASRVVAFGTDALTPTGWTVPRHVRISLLGEMQRPPLDGPVDWRPHE